MPTIRISTELYKRLESHAKGFDTPAGVLERALNVYEGKPEYQKAVTKPTMMNKPTLSFHPDEESFRQSLINNKMATVVLHHGNGESEEKNWDASRFGEKSNLRGNIWSGFMRGWKDQNIVRAEFRAE